MGSPSKLSDDTDSQSQSSWSGFWCARPAGPGLDCDVCWYKAVLNTELCLKHFQLHHVCPKLTGCSVGAVGGGAVGGRRRGSDWLMRESAMHGALVARGRWDHDLLDVWALR